MFGKTTQKLFGALVIIGLLLTSIGSTRGSAASRPAVVLPVAGAAGMAAPQAATPIDPSPYDQYSPRLAGDSAGNLFALWMDTREGNTNPHVRFAYRPAGGAWQPSSKLDGAGARQYRAALAVDGRGNAYAAWTDRRGGYDQIYAAVRPASGAWSAGQVVSPTLSSQQSQTTPSLAVNQRGDAVVAWAQGQCCANPQTVYVAARPAGGPWGAAERVGQGSSWGPAPAVALDAWGRVSVVWLDATRKQVAFADRPAGGPWSAVRNIRDSTVGSVMMPQLAADSAGNLHAIWADDRNGDLDIYAAYRPDGGPWSANVPVTDHANKDAVQPALSVDGAGNAYAVWSDYRAGSAIYTATRYRGGGWGPNHPLVTWPPTAGRTAGRAAGAPDAGIRQESISFSATMWALLAASVALLYTAPGNVADEYNVYYQDIPAGGSSGQCGPLGGPAASVAATGPAQGGGGDPCHGGNAAEAPPYNGDIGDLPPSSADANWQPGITTVHIEGQTYYVVVAPDGQQAAYPDQGTAEMFYHSHPVPENTEQPQFYLPEDNAPQDAASPPADTADPGPSAEPADSGFAFNQEAIAQLAAAMNTWIQQWGNPTQPGAAQQTPVYAQWYVISLLSQSVYFNRPLTAEELQILLSHQQYLAAAPSEILTLYGQIQQVKPEWQVNVANLAGMTPEGFAELQAQIAGIIAAQEQAAAEAAALQAAQQAQNQPAAQGGIPAHRPTTLLGMYANLLAYGEEAWEISQLPPNDPRVQAWLEHQAAGVTPQQVALEAVAQAFAQLADPILPHSGEFIHTETPLRIPGRGLDYAFRLTYRSQLVYNGPAGWGWMHNYDRRVADVGAGSLGAWDGAGLAGLFSFDGAGFTPSAGRFTAVVSTTAGITLTDRSGLVEGYLPLDGTVAAGRLRSITDRNGNILRFAYDAQGRLQTVTDTLSRIIAYAYDAHSRLATVTDFAGRGVRLTYDASGDLVGITTPAVTGTPNGNDFPQGKTTRFAYTSGFSDQRLNHNLTTIISPNEAADGSLTPRTINTYGTSGLAFDRVTRQSWGGGRSNASGIPAGGTVTLAYSTAIESTAPAGAHSKTTITDRGGNVLELWHDGAGHRLADRQTVGGQALLTGYTYNTDGLLTAITYPAGNRVEYRYDEGATNRLAQGNLLELRRVADAPRGCDGLGAAPCPPLVTTYTYEPVFQKLKTITDAHGATTTYSYDARGNLTQVTFPDVTVGPAAPQAASEIWTYNAFGQPLTFADPEGAVTRYEYYTTGPAIGYRQRVVRDASVIARSGVCSEVISPDARDCFGAAAPRNDAAIVTTTYVYDAVGNVTAVTDGRGIRTDYTVNALNQVVKVTRATTIPNTQSLTRTSRNQTGA